MKLINLLPFLITATISTTINPADKVLDSNQLKEIFPDSNLRSVVKRYIVPSEMTINNIKALDGEFYASGENISNLDGISLLENVDSFVFWNNKIKEIPNDILKLKDIDSINLANNYLTDDSIIDAMVGENINVNYDLNFIDNKTNQYQLESESKIINLSKGESIDLRKVIFKDANYYKYWEVCNELPKDLEYVIVNSNNNIISLNGTFVTANNIGQSLVRISLDNKENISQEVCISINVD